MYDDEEEEEEEEDDLPGLEDDSLVLSRDEMLKHHALLHQGSLTPGMTSTPSDLLSTASDLYRYVLPSSLSGARFCESSQKRWWSCSC